MSEKIPKTPWIIPPSGVYKVVAAALVITWQSGSPDAGLTMSYTGKVKTAAEVPALLRHGNVAHSQRRCSGVFLFPLQPGTPPGPVFPMAPLESAPESKHSGTAAFIAFPRTSAPHGISWQEAHTRLKGTHARVRHHGLQIFPGLPLPLLPGRPGGTAEGMKQPEHQVK